MGIKAWQMSYGPGVFTTLITILPEQLNREPICHSDGDYRNILKQNTVTHHAASADALHVFRAPCNVLAAERQAVCRFLALVAAAAKRCASHCPPAAGDLTTALAEPDAQARRS